MRLLDCFVIIRLFCLITNRQLKLSVASAEQLHHTASKQRAPSSLSHTRIHTNIVRQWIHEWPRRGGVRERESVSPLPHTHTHKHTTARRRMRHTNKSNGRISFPSWNTHVGIVVVCVCSLPTTTACERAHTVPAANGEYET